VCPVALLQERFILAFAEYTDYLVVHYAGSTPGHSMAKNDRILIDGIIDDRIALKLPSDKRDEAFEYLAFEQILKDFDLSQDEILLGSIDGRGDGGIDGFYVLVNGHLLQDPESFTWPRIGSDLRVVLISCKHADTFRQATLDAIIATLTEVLDFGIADQDLKGAYSDSLLRMRANLRFAYRKLSPRLSSFSIAVVYASRGDAVTIGTEVRARAEHLKRVIKDCFGSSKVGVGFLGCSELVELHRKIQNYTLELPFVEALAKGERYVILCRLSDYFNFISDDGHLRRYLFESNVRDFMGLNRVNEEIRTTLEDSQSPDFWWLNNGVTIVATSASIIGKSIQASDVQIVNGLQTTESIFRHFNESGHKVDERCLLVKVIVTQDDAVRDSIIRATNNQTDVELASLHATDKIQRDIEDVLLRNGLFYERRKNHYANQGLSPRQIVSPLYMAAGYVALVLKIPHRAAKLRSKFMRSNESYDTVFSRDASLDIWPKIGHLLKRIDVELERLRPKGKGTERFLKEWRYMVALLAVARATGRYSFTASDLLALDLSKIDANAVDGIWTELRQFASKLRLVGGWTSHASVIRACQSFAATHEIADLESLTRQASKGHALEGISRPVAPEPHVSDEFIQRVRALLPPQPWKPGLHKQVAAQLGCTQSEYFVAVTRLIDDGIVHQQRDGVVYDADGNVVAFDPDRVDPATLTLLSEKD
jgi:hypothetical protein